MDNNIADTKGNKNSENQYNWIHTILSIPKIGGLLTSVIAITPAILIFLSFSMFTLFFKSEKSKPPEESLWIYFFLVFGIVLILIVTWWWLNYLERKINLAIMLPIPFINIPIKWILYPFMLPFFGIRKIYRHFAPKRSIDNIDSLNVLESEDKQ